MPLFKSGKMPNVLIVTRTKNRPLLLARAIKSVQQQTFTDYLHVIVNDGGEEAEVEQLLSSFARDNINVIHNKHSLGMEAASNVGLRFCVADYAVIHDDDDSWEPDFLLCMVAYLQANPEQAGVVCNIRQVFERVTEGDVESISSRLFNPAVTQFKLADFFVCNQFVPIGFLYRYELHNKVGFFNESLKVCGDLEFHIRVLQDNLIAKLDLCLANYHIRVNTHNLALINSVNDVDSHQQLSSKVIAEYDQRTRLQCITSLLRVKLVYRFINIVRRFYER